MESIQNFENKQEFRVVKLKTRQSFREDQAALDRRLSKVRMKHNAVQEMDLPNGVTNGQPNGVTNGHIGHVGDKSALSKLESIVLDINTEMEEETTRKNSTVDVIANETDETRSCNISVDNNINVGDNMQENAKYMSSGVLVNGQLRSQHVSVQHRLDVEQTRQTTQQKQQHHINDSRVANGSVPSGHVILQNGQPFGHSTLLIRPKITGQARAAMTPEPRLKSFKGIYQKNPKLSTASTDHLDNVSLTGIRPASNSLG